MLFDGHKQKLFGMSSTILVSPKMPPTNRRGRSADQQRTWTRLTYGRSSFSPVQDALHKNGLVQSWGSTKGLLLLHIRNPNPSSSWLKSSSQKPLLQCEYHRLLLTSEPLYSYARSNVYTRPRSTIHSSSLSCSSHIIILTRTLIAVADSSEYPPSQ